MADSQPLEIEVRPGVFKTGTSQVARGRYIDCNKIRFKSGKPEKWSGWVKTIASSLLGVARGALGWIDSGGTNILLTGTAYKAYSITDTLTDITPYRAVNGTGSLGANPFTTTSGTKNVSVAHTAHSVIVSQHVHFAGATTFNSVTMNGEWIVASVTDANNYVVTYTSNASGTGAGGGGAVTFAYEIQPGLENSAAGLGAGVGPVGAGTVGTPRTTGASISLDLRTWFFCRYGNEIMCVPSGDTIFLWNEPNSDPRPLPLAGAPANVYAFFITAERFPVALGTTLGRMVMQWPDVDTLSWSPDITNEANARRLQYGNKLIAGAVVSDKVNVFWSDTAFYAMNFTGGPFIYDTPVIGTNCGLIGPCAFASTPVGVMWMSPQDFHIYSGQLDYIPNRMDIRDWLFRNLDTDRAAKICCDYDHFNNSVIWSICFTGDTEPSHYAEVSLDDFSWNVGTWDNGGNRTAIANFDFPTGPFMMIGDDAGGVNGFVYQHNFGTDANGVSMPWQLTRGIIGLSDGDLDAEVEYYEPDYERQIGTVTLEVRALERPMVDWYLQDEFYSIPQGTVLLHLAPVIGGRYIQTIESGSGLGNDWRGGLSKIWLAPGGEDE